MALLPRRFLQGCAALLALALSALGGSRIGFDRLIGGDGRVDDQAVVRRAEAADAVMDVAQADVACAPAQDISIEHDRGSVAGQVELQPLFASPDVLLAAATPAVAAPRDCPALLLGSSRGPRAP